jgi:E3 ubiquitin-protein ligase TRIP12
MSSVPTLSDLASHAALLRAALQIQLLSVENNPDVMLMAARALTFMADILPQSCHSIVRHGAVPVFCARLLTIEYIDLAEQSLLVRLRTT